jgi:hypothetical protein
LRHLRKKLKKRKQENKRPITHKQEKVSKKKQGGRRMREFEGKKSRS